VIVLDAGALIAIDRGDRTLAAAIKREIQSGRVPKTHGGVVGQVWRGSARQTRLAQLLALIEVTPLDRQLGRRSGALLAATGLSNVVDAALVMLCTDGDLLVTSDPIDMTELAEAAGLRIDIVRA
jgi:hypothetical protein